MKLSEFAVMVQRQLERKPDAEVVIVTSMPSVGGRRMVPLTHLTLGFDWEAGKAILTPAEPLYTRTQEEEIRALRQQIDGLVWENHNLKKGVKLP